jgi:hypothetical protein
LGVFHPKRIELFQEFGVTGSDCKGWIFNYLKQDEVVDLIKGKKLHSNCRISVADLKVRQVQRMSEQELRFKLTRGYIENKMLAATKNAAKTGRRLLIVSCSKRKRRSSKRIPAIQLYDGGALRVLKKLLREQKLPSDVDVLILSAKHGLLEPDASISSYNIRMTPALAQKQAAANVSILKAKLDDGRFQEVFLTLGAAYLDALGPIPSWQKPGVKVTVNKGRIGEQLGHLKAWLLNGEVNTKR